MRLAVISDIHGNLAALEAVLYDLESLGGADLTWCLGDLAAFGPRPAECIRRIKALAEVMKANTSRSSAGILTAIWSMVSAFERLPRRMKGPSGNWRVNGR